jgi:hypothetical protein
MTQRADEQICINAPAHTTALMQAFFGKALHHPGLSVPHVPDLAPWNFWFFPKLKLPLKGRRLVNVTVTQYTSSISGVSLPTDWPHGRVTVHGCTVRSPLTGCQVTSRLHDRFSRYSKWLGTFRTGLIFEHCHSWRYAWYTHCFESWLYLSWGSLLYHLCNYSQKLMPLTCFSV